ncbi:dihydropteroate synthase [Psychroflexus maritimus]|nr:dihydropteroate synthase [Psychroflexus maritimus]
MGVLNITPDSFYDGGRYKDSKSVLLQAEKMISEGVDFIDLGAYSSRPGAKNIDENTEKSRLLPILEELVKEFPQTPYSIDTFRSSVAEEALNLGAALINDISAGKLDDQMMATVAKYKVPYVMMHMLGTPQNMQELNSYENIINTINYYFSSQIKKARALGIADIILDPGFGFAKNSHQNFEILHSLNLFKNFEVPLLVGLSRKSMIYRNLGITPSEALNGTSVLNTIAILKGASILRVHDVKEAKEVIELCSLTFSNKK